MMDHIWSQSCSTRYCASCNNTQAGLRSQLRVQLKAWVQSLLELALQKETRECAAETRGLHPTESTPFFSSARSRECAAEVRGLHPT